MSVHFNQPVRFAAAVLTVGTIAAFVACSEPSVSPSDAGVRVPSEPAAIASVGDQLAELRAATAKFHDFAGTTDVGAPYAKQLTGCMVDTKTNLGGMGFHYAKESAIDDNVNLLEPEALLYEPQKNGQMRLVAVEYVVPYAVRPRSGPPPVLFGQDFLQTDEFGVWALHAWVWKNNPAGMFAPWNPVVNCDAVPAAARMTH
jgi:hypothetical protein